VFFVRFDMFSGVGNDIVLTALLLILLFLVVIGFFVSFLIEKKSILRSWYLQDVDYTSLITITLQILGFVFCF